MPELEQGQSSALYMEEAQWIECSWDSSKSIYFLRLFLPSVFFGVVYIIGFPVLVFVLLYRNRHQLDSHKMETMMGFLYENYKPNLWWVEVLLMGRRISIAAAMSLIPEGKPVSQEFVLVILVSFLFFFQFLRPYRNRADVNCEIVSIVSLLILINTGVNYQQFTTKSWLNILGLVFYLGTLVTLVVVLVYPQLKSRIVNCRNRPIQEDSEYNSLLINSEEEHNEEDNKQFDNTSDKLDENRGEEEDELYNVVIPPFAVNEAEFNNSAAANDETLVEIGLRKEDAEETSL